MNKNVIFLLATVIALVIGAMYFTSQKNEEAGQTATTTPEAEPANGLVTAPAEQPQTTAPAAMEAAPATAPAAAPDASDQVPAGAEVTGDAAAPAEGALPPSEGQ